MKDDKNKLIMGDLLLMIFFKSVTCHMFVKIFASGKGVVEPAVAA
jgi:hypothetical protein